ncbi:MAG: nitrous oxide-stimulated promoter family protein [Chloroflexi bacterium]|nr:nitrous oxide-stimulated promoter family protein [Chloroflexota bacterium]
MSELFNRINDRVAKDMGTVADFVAIFCKEKHDGAKEPFPIKDERLREVLEKKDLVLCPECSKLLQHAVVKLLLCPQDPKPMCKKCTIHCYAPWYRERIREVMKFSGMYLIKHGRLDMMMHYVL